MPDKDAVDARDALGMAAKRFMANSRTAIEAILRPYGLGSSQWWVLERIAVEGQVRQRELPAAMHVERAAASEIVLTLVRRGLIAQSTDPADQRQKVLSLTAAGESLRSVIPNPMQQLYEIAFDGCSDDALVSAAAILMAAVERLETTKREGDTR